MRHRILDQGGRSRFPLVDILEGRHRETRSLRMFVSGSGQEPPVAPRPDDNDPDVPPPIQEPPTPIPVPPMPGPPPMQLRSR